MLWAIHPYDQPEDVSETVRKSFAKDSLSALKPAVRGSGWRKRENVLFRRLDNYFVSAEFKVASNREQSWVEIRIKPFELDTLLWQITKIDAHDWPLSARAFYAAMCPAPIFRKKLWDDAGLMPQSNATRLMDELDAVPAMIDKLASGPYSDFVAAVDKCGDFTMAQALSLVLEGREAEALVFAQDCADGLRTMRTKRSFVCEPGGPSRDVHELIAEWVRSVGTRMTRSTSEGESS